MATKMISQIEMKIEKKIQFLFSMNIHEFFFIRCHIVSVAFLRLSWGIYKYKKIELFNEEKKQH